MVRESSLQEVVRSIADRITRTTPQPHQVDAAIEYAIVRAYARTRDVWANCITIPAADFLSAIKEYFLNLPRVESNITAQFREQLSLRPTPTKRRKHSADPRTFPFLRVTFA